MLQHKLRNFKIKLSPTFLNNSFVSIWEVLRFVFLLGNNLRTNKWVVRITKKKTRINRRVPGKLKED